MIVNHFLGHPSLVPICLVVSVLFVVATFVFRRVHVALIDLGVPWVVCACILCINCLGFDPPALEKEGVSVVDCKLPPLDAFAALLRSSQW